MLDVSENDALTLEYKLYERGTLRHVDVSYFINNPKASGLFGEDESGLAFSASIPRGRKFIFLPERIAEGQMGVSIEYKKIATVEGPESGAITAVDLFHLGLTTHPIFSTGAWLSNFSLMRNPPPRLKELRESWFAGQRPSTRIDPKYRSRSAYPFSVWEGYL